MKGIKGLESGLPANLKICIIKAFNGLNGIFMSSSPLGAADQMVSQQVAETVFYNTAILTVISAAALAILARVHPGFRQGVKSVVMPPVALISTTLELTGLATGALLGTFPRITGTVVWGTLGYGAYQGTQKLL